MVVVVPASKTHVAVVVVPASKTHVAVVVVVVMMCMMAIARQSHRLSREGCRRRRHHPAAAIHCERCLLSAALLAQLLSVALLAQLLAALGLVGPAVAPLLTVEEWGMMMNYCCQCCCHCCCCRLRLVARTSPAAARPLHPF